jgi:mannose-6-phosphate isomerase-like protein (cupin superfamily)
MSGSIAQGARGKRLALAVIALGVAGAAIAFGAMQAAATPGAGIVGGPILARGAPAQDVVLGVPTTTTVRRTVVVRVGRKVVRKRVSFRVPTVRPLATCAAAGPCDIAFQQITIAPGGHTGWHTHPGPTFVAMAQGEGTLYHGVSGCPTHKYGVGTGFFQPTTEVHNFRNEGSTQLTLLAFYMLPAGTPNTGIRVDQPQPSSCPNIP